MTQKRSNRDYSEKEIEQRRDEALRRALNSPPKENEELKKGNRKLSTSKASGAKKKP